VRQREREGVKMNVTISSYTLVSSVDPKLMSVVTIESILRRQLFKLELLQNPLKVDFLERPKKKKNLLKFLKKKKYWKTRDMLSRKSVATVDGFIRYLIFVLLKILVASNKQSLLPKVQK